MSLVEKLVKKLDNSDIIKFSDKDNFKDMKSWASMGSPSLEKNLGVLGLPTGIIEIAGRSKSGKTTLGLMGMFYFLKKNENGIAVILSSENRDNKEYALKLGIDPSRVMIVKIRYVEKMFMIVKTLIEDTKEMFREENLGEPKFYFIWDSLGATLSKAELDTMKTNTDEMQKKFSKGEDIEKLKHEQIGAFAKSAKMFAKFLLGEMYNTTIHFVMLNHVYDTIGFGISTKKSTGGEWVELFPCLRLLTSVVGHEKIDEVEVAQYTEVKVVKNDFGSRAKTKICILLGRGVILSDDDIDFGVEQGIITKSGSKKFEAINGKLVWSSKRTLFDMYEKNPKLVNVMTKKILDAMHEKILSERVS